MVVVDVPLIVCIVDCRENKNAISDIVIKDIIRILSILNVIYAEEIVIYVAVKRLVLIVVLVSEKMLLGFVYLAKHRENVMIVMIIINIVMVAILHMEVMGLEDALPVVRAVEDVLKIKYAHYAIMDIPQILLVLIAILVPVVLIFVSIVLIVFARFVKLDITLVVEAVLLVQPIVPVVLVLRVILVI